MKKLKFILLFIIILIQNRLYSKDKIYDSWFELGLNSISSSVYLDKLNDRLLTADLPKISHIPSSYGILSSYSIYNFNLYLCYTAGSNLTNDSNYNLRLGSELISIALGYDILRSDKFSISPFLRHNMFIVDYNYSDKLFENDFNLFLKSNANSKSWKYIEQDISGGIDISYHANFLCGVKFFYIIAKIDDKWFFNNQISTYTNLPSMRLKYSFEFYFGYIFFKHEKK